MRTRAARWCADGMTNQTPVLFIHGLWLHASSWQPWADLFAREGYQPLTPGWPGDSATVAETRDNPESVADYGVDDVVEHYAAIIAELPDRPILVGHSFGGMIAQKLLGQDLAAAAVAIDAAQIKGVLPLPLSALRATLPVFKNPANKHKSVTLTAGAVPVRLRERAERRGIRRAVSALDDSRARPSAVRGRRRELQPARIDQSRHPQQLTWPAAADQRRQRSHGAGKRGQGHARAVPAFRGSDRHHRLPGPGPLADHRQRVAGGRDYRARLAATAVTRSRAMDLHCPVRPPSSPAPAGALAWPSPAG